MIHGTHTGLTIHSSGTILGTGTDHGFMTLGTGMILGTTEATTDTMADITVDTMVATMAGQHTTHTITIIAHTTHILYIPAQEVLAIIHTTVLIAERVRDRAIAAYLPT